MKPIYASSSFTQLFLLVTYDFTLYCVYTSETDFCETACTPFFNFFIVVQLQYIYFILENGWLTVLWEFQVDSKGTQPHMFMCPFFPRLPSHVSCHVTLSRVPCAITNSRSLLVIYFKCSRTYMSTPDSLTIPSPTPSFLVTKTSKNTYF